MRNASLFTGLMLISIALNGQYLETFDVANKGILIPPCTTNDPTSCVSFDFSGVDWTIGGDLSGLDNGQAPPNEGVQTSGGVFTTLAGDVDEEVCWLSPELDISNAGNDVDFNVDITYTGFDDSDYMDVEYSIDGGAFIVAQPNLVGTGGHTINGSSGSGGISGSQNNVGITGGLSGNTLQIRVCADFNSSSENFSVDNVSAPDANIVVLPVEIISFNAESRDANILLEWATASELNNKLFEIEHRTQSRPFEKIGEVHGLGTTSQLSAYSFQHNEPAAGSNYYRLKQIDLDGRFEYSKVIVVNFKRIKEAIGDFYPNPSNSGLTSLDYSSENEINAVFTVFDATGKICSDQIRKVYSGISKLSFDFSILKSGIYIIKIQHKGQPTYRKLIIEN